MNYGLWAVLTPLIIYLSRKLPFEQANWQRTIVLLFLLGIAIALLHSALQMTISFWASLSTERNFSILHLLSDHLLPILPIKFLIFSAILGAGYAFQYYKRNREHLARLDMLEKQLVQAKLDALKSQLQPHFLFNTLNSVSALAENDPGSARRMIARLSDLLRLTLDSKEKHEITLDEELTLLKHYLEIEKVRFQERLKLAMEISKEARKALVPNMILQPLVENAIRHGVAKRRKGGIVTISAIRENGMLKIEVWDDGPGMADSPEKSNASGVGLQNTQSRLEQLYGDRHNFDLVDLNGRGLKVSFAIPFHEMPVA